MHGLALDVAKVECRVVVVEMSRRRAAAVVMGMAGDGWDGGEEEGD